MKRIFRTLFVSIAALLGISPQAKALSKVPSPEQQSLTIYQIMVASFQHSADGAPGYTAMWGPDANLKSGNLQGIIEALPHIKALGANAIWLTPVFDASKGEWIDHSGEKLQATGYYANNFFDIDPHFGTKDDFRRLVDTCHNLGLYVFLDGVFGHHGGISEPSPQGNMPFDEFAENDRGIAPGNVKYPESLPYFTEVATYWINEYGIDGWRVDQAYQLLQNGHNYWTEIRNAVENAAKKRRGNGEKWGTLGYIVAEDLDSTQVINNGVYRDGGVLSAFDFDGKERISGPLQKNIGEGLDNGWDDVILTLSSPAKRGYFSDSIAPNLFVTNHDGYRLADHFDPVDPHYLEKQMARFAILAAYNGPITLYYGDEFGDRSLETHGAQPDNIARTTGHLSPRNDNERRLYDYVANAMNIRRNNTAMWRGEISFEKNDIAGVKTLIVRKTDPTTGHKAIIVFADGDTTVPVHGYGAVDVDAWRPEIISITPPQKNGLQ